jgi:hypothetical protein
MIGEKKFEAVSKNHKSLLSYMAFHMQMNMVVKGVEKIKVMKSIFDFINRILYLMPGFITDLKKVKILKDNKSNLNKEALKQYLKSFKPFNQNLNNLQEKLNNIVDQDEKPNNNISINSHIIIKKLYFLPKTKVKDSADNFKKIVFEKKNILLNSLQKTVLEDKTVFLNAFYENNKWLTKIANNDFHDIDIVHDAENLNGPIDSMIAVMNARFKFNFTTFSDLLNLFENNEINAEKNKKILNNFMNEIASYNINRFMGKYLHSTQFFLQKSDDNKQLSDLFNYYNIKGIDILVDNFSTKIVVRLLLYSLLTTITLLMHDLFCSDSFIDTKTTFSLIYGYENNKISIIGDFISKALTEMTIQKTVINKEKLELKYNQLISLDRQQKLNTTTSLSSEAYEIYLSKNQNGLENFYTETNEQYDDKHIYQNNYDNEENGENDDNHIFSD